MTVCCFILNFIEIPKNCYGQQGEICKEKIVSLLLTTVNNFFLLDLIIWLLKIDN